MKTGIDLGIFILGTVVCYVLVRFFGFSASTMQWAVVALFGFIGIRILYRAVNKIRAKKKYEGL